MTRTAKIIQFKERDMKAEEKTDSGYIRLYRSLQESAFSDRPEYLATWIHILMRASHRSRKAMLGNQSIIIAPGQFISGRKALAEIVGITEKQMRNVLDFLESEGMITRKSSRVGTVFTVCNYSFFQEKEGQEGPTVSGQHEGQGKTTNGEGCSEIEAKEGAAKRPTKRATTQEHNKSISNEIDNNYGSSDQSSGAKKPSPKNTKRSYPDEFEWIWANKPNREGSNPKQAALKACNARIKQGATWRELAAGVKRYHQFCETKGSLNTEYVMQMATFFGPDEHFRNEWSVNKSAQTHQHKGPDFDDLSWAQDLGEF